MKRNVVFNLFLAALLTAPFQGVQWHAEAAGASATSPEEPAIIMAAIYRQAIKDASSGWLEPKERRKYLSQSLLALWAKADAKKPPEGDTGPIDFDLTADTNGLTLESFAVRLRSQSAAAAVVDVTLGYQKPYSRSGGPAIVSYDFVREDNRWRIDNIHTKAWSLRDILTRWLNES